MGYFSLDNLKLIDQQKAFYLSRLPLKNRIYQKNPAPEFLRNGAIKKKQSTPFVKWCRSSCDNPP
ncbi:hypothetical protein [Shimazuella alba]|uniref:Transposase DDE domain-containing protein n=1 Tax=Shimazuella alba TaxID=2690964 RepID=A0A6I4VLX2_9BACL|nr:hypothetical protein [Shimazuella alba]